MKKKTAEMLLKMNFGAVNQIEFPLEIIRQGACAGRDTDLFFSEVQEERAEALMLCGGCPVVGSCLAYAMDFEEFGIWGGTTPEERAKQRGHLKVYSAEEWLETMELRQDLLSLPALIFSKKYCVTERTFYRWRDSYCGQGQAA